MALDFSRRRHGNKQELNKFFIRMSNESFGDVRHHRACSALNLSTVTKILLTTSILIDRLINLPCELPGFLPTIEVFESGELHLLVNLVCLVFLVSVYLVCLVYLVYAVGLASGIR
jgi:hypothetical protein